MTLAGRPHRHGRRVHVHPHSGRHRHLTAPRLSQPLPAGDALPRPGSWRESRRTRGGEQHPDGRPHRHRHGGEGECDHSHGAEHAHSHATEHGHSHGAEHGHSQGHSHGHSHGAKHGHSQGTEHGHSHGLIDESIKRSHEGIRAVSLSLAVLGLTALAQTAVFVASGSIALLADLIHNFGDALTALPLGIAFALRSHTAERRAGLAVVGAIFVSACVAAFEAVSRLIGPSAPTHLAMLAVAGAIGFAGNFLAGRIRVAAGRRLHSPALVADGHHARADAYVSLAVIASAVVVALGLAIADPLIGLLITLVIARISWQSWQTVRGQHVH